MDSQYSEDYDVLHIFNKTYRILKMSMGYEKKVEASKKPVTRPFHKPITLLLEPTTNDSEMHAHTFSPELMISEARIEHCKFNTNNIYDETLPDTIFANAYIVGLEEGTHLLEGTREYLMQVQFSVQYISIQGIESQTPTNPDKPYSNVTPTVREVEEASFTAYYFEDLEGKKIAKETIRSNQEIMLVLVTKGAMGKSMTISLTNSRLDFIYKGKTLKNDTLTGIQITDEETRVPLTAIIQ